DINRSRFSALPSELGNELLMYWLRQSGLSDFDRQTINRLNTAIRTSKNNTSHPVKKDLTIDFGTKTARLRHGPLKVF
ncbi:MAG TPA: hypothetical protein VFW90_01965, partial [Candidatus Saccharimonadales bacterium]|nr:hypothetical protein [Candidatus Saccharimonadales bacterium]